MENGSCGASPECSCNVEWKQSIKLLCVSSAGATVSTRLNSFIDANIHIYILPLSPKLHCFYAENKPVAVSCPSPVLVVHIDWFPADTGASALFFLVLVVSHSGRDKCGKKTEQFGTKMKIWFMADVMDVIFEGRFTLWRVEGLCCWLAFNVFLK